MGSRLISLTLTHRSLFFSKKLNRSNEFEFENQTLLKQSKHGLRQERDGRRLRGAEEIRREQRERRRFDGQDQHHGRRWQGEREGRGCSGQGHRRLSSSTAWARDRRTTSPLSSRPRTRRLAITSGASTRMPRAARCRLRTNKAIGAGGERRDCWHCGLILGEKKVPSERSFGR